MVLLALCWSTQVSQAASSYPYHQELEWYNIDVDGHRAAVFSMLTDSRGLMWIGTGQGLFLYDGSETHAMGGEALTGLQVYAIVEHEGQLLLGTNHGLQLFMCNEGKVVPQASARQLEIRCMLDCGDHLLVGSLSGLYSYNYKSRQLTDMGTGLPNPSVYSLLRDSQGTLYAGTFNGLARYDTVTSRFRTVTSSQLSHSSQSSFVNSLLESADHHTLYIGTGEGLYTYRPGEERWDTVGGLEEPTIKSLATDRDGRLLVGTYNGLYYQDGPSWLHYQRDTRKPTSPAGNQIWTVMTDESGTVWIGHEHGISMAANSTFSHTIKVGTLVSSGESNEFLTLLRDSKGRLWLGGTNGVIVRHADGHARWFKLNDNNGADAGLCVRSVMEDSEGTVWLSTDGGILRYREATADFDVFILSDAKGDRTSNWVYAIRLLGDDLWVASYLGGVNRIARSKLSGGGGVVRADFSLDYGVELASDNISNMVADDNGCLWILLYGDHRLYQYDTTAKKVKQHDIRQMTGSAPTHICMDSASRLWCAYKGGCLMFDRNSHPTDIRFPLSGGDETVLAIAPVDGDVWVSTLSNLWRIDGSSLTPSPVPVPQKGFAAILDDAMTGHVLLGGLDEVVEVNKASLVNAQGFGQVRMVLECRNGQPVDMQNLADPSATRSGLHIPNGGSVLLMVSTLDYSPDMVQHIEYRVVRKGADTESPWIVMPERASMINLTDMSFGNYEIQIKTVGSPLPPVVVPLKVDVPFYISWPAILFYCLLMAGIVAAAFWYQRRRAMRRAQEKEREETLANVERKLAFLSDEKHDLETRIEQLLKSRDEMTTQLRLRAITEAKPIEVESPVEKQLADIAHIVEENISELELNGAFIAERCAMSDKQLYRLLKKHLDVTPSEYIRNIRMQKAAMLLQQNYFTVSEVAYMVGFSAPSYFSKCFQDHFGMAPSNYNNGGDAHKENGQ